jgi:hypothetical protein
MHRTSEIKLSRSKSQATAGRQSKLTATTRTENSHRKLKC